MYCGDETGSFIGEVGSHTCRFGYGGEDNPKLVIPSHVVDKKRMASSPLSYPSKSSTFESILRMPDYQKDAGGSLLPLTDPSEFYKQGDSVQDWDNLNVAWDTGMNVLKAKDTLKHTKGGTPYPQTTTSTSTTSTTITNNDTKTTDGKCIHPILAITPGFTEYEGYGPSYCAALKRQQYIKYTELMMETMEAKSLFLAPSPMLAAFSLGRKTALVVDLGAGGCRVTPVVDGHILKHSQRRNGRGGDWMGNITWKAMLEEKIPIKPQYQLRQQQQQQQQRPKKTIESNKLFHTWAMLDLMYQVRTDPSVTVDLYSRGIPFMNQSSAIPQTPETPSSVSPSNLELPDGTSIDLSTSFGKSLTRVPELLFTDMTPFSSGSMTGMGGLETLSNAPLHKLIQESLLAVGDVDARKELVGNICLSGGSSVLPNLDSRLSYELSTILPGFVKPKVIASRNSVERTCAAWIGASILTSLGSFQQLWLSRTEYEEYGATMAIQRFP